MKLVQTSLKLTSVFTISAMLLTSCGNEAGKQEGSIVNADTAATTQPTNDAASTVDEMVDFKFHYLTANIPSPMELVDALPNAGIAFNKEVINPTEKESKYLTSLQKAINFGIYSVDMAYLTTNEEFGLLKGYLNTSRNMAKSLDLSETFDKVVGKRLSENAENKDSLKKVIDEAYYEVDNYMRNNERALAATQMLTGSWLESQYITLQVVQGQTKNEKNALLFNKIFEQKRHLESLVSLLKEYEKDKSFSPAIKQMNELNTIYASMKTADLEDAAFMAKLKDAVSKVRQEFVK